MPVRISNVGFAWCALLLLSRTAAAETAKVVLPAELHLEEAVKNAVEHQPTMLQAKAQTEAAAGRVEQARSGYLPQINGVVLYQRVHGSVRNVQGGIPVPTGTTATGSYDVFSAGVNGTQLLWDFGQTIQQTRAASASREAQQAGERTARHQVVFDVRQAFFQAYAQRALVRVGEETVANQERHLKQIQGFVEQQIRPEIDLAQARTDLANARVTLTNARGAYATAKARLNQAMGVAGSTRYEVADDEMPPVPGEDGPADPLVVTAMNERPELETLKRQQRASELTLSSIRGAYGPTLSALGGISEAGLALDRLNTNWNAGVVLQWPLFQGGLTQGQTREASANIQVAKAALTQQELAVRVDVEQALVNVAAAKVSIAAARDAVKNAREQLRLAEGRYESGVGSIIELDDAQLAVANTGAQLVQAEYNLATARASLLSAIGK